MKKICFFSGDITRSGGTEKVACQIITGLAKEYEISVVSLCHEDKQTYFYLPKNVSTVALFSKNPNVTTEFLKIVKSFRNYIKHNRINVVIAIDSILCMFALPAVSHTKTKLVSWEHFNYYETLGNRFRIPIRKLSTRFADYIVTLTDEDRANYINNTSAKARIQRIYNPIELHRDYEENNTYNKDSKCIISVGRLAFQKGYDLLLEIADMVLKKHPDWKWIILGEGDERKQLEKKASELKLNNIEFLGRKQNVSEYMQQSAIFVLTSRFEGFPLVLIEAKANLLPVVAFRCRTGPSEMVRDGENGFLVDCFDTNLMAERIDTLIEDVELRKQFSSKSLLDTEKLDYKTIIDQWIDLLESV